MARPPPFLALWCLASTVGSSAWAQDGSEDGALELFNLEQALQTQVESAALSAQTVETSPSVISVFTREQLQAWGVRRLSELLQRVAGITVLDTAQGEKRFAFRGISNPANVLVTLDGHRINDFYNGAFPGDFRLEGIERVEVIRGPASALYGTNAFAGIVSMYTRDDRGVSAGVQGEALLDNQTAWGGTGHARASQRWDNGWSAQAFALFEGSEGPKVLAERDLLSGTAFTLTPALTHAPARQAQGQLEVAKDGLWVAGDRLELAGLLVHQRRSPYFGINRTFAREGSTSLVETQGHLEYRRPWGAAWQTRLRLEVQRIDQTERVQVQPPGFVYDVSRDFVIDPGELYVEGLNRGTERRSYHLGVRLQATHDVELSPAFPRNQLTFGVQAENDRLPYFVYGQNTMGGLYQGTELRNYDNLPLNQRGRSRTVLAAFLQDQLRIGDQTYLTVGGRFDRYSDFGNTLNPRVSLVVLPLPNLSTKLMYGRAFRAPTFLELYDLTGQRSTPAGFPVRGNPALRPETTESLEVAVEWAALSFLNVRANGFLTNTANLIDLDPTFNVAGSQFTNYPGRRIVGVEGEVQLVFDRYNYFTGNATWFQSNQLGEGLAGYATVNDRRFVIKEMTDVPRLRVNGVFTTRPLANAGANLLGRTQVSLLYSYVSESSNNNRNIFESLYPFQRPAFHQGRLTVGTEPVPNTLEVRASYARSVGQVVPITVSTGWYELPSPSQSLFLEVVGKL